MIHTNAAEGIWIGDAQRGFHDKWIIADGQQERALREPHRVINFKCYLPMVFLKCIRLSKPSEIFQGYSLHGPSIGELSDLFHILFMLEQSCCTLKA